MIPAAPRFIVDLNVGRLARWLRVLGYDALFLPSGSDDDLIRVAWQQGRIILTKDRGLLQRRAVTRGPVRALHVRSDDVWEQLQQVVGELGLEMRYLFCRCIECNEPLSPVERQLVEGRVPPYVLQTQRQFMECLSCRRVYWKGTHWQNMQAELSKVQTWPASR
ncbi:MAG: Mut7-C RNAse domain-containing protein [Chloroflexi bacterium]|nr:Mut7-C RNAse domain-containing protein [Chloroflexota bacterium]